MIAATASSKKYQFDYVVTDDNSFRKRLNRQNTSTKAVTFDEFKSETVRRQIALQTKN